MYAVNNLHVCSAFFKIDVIINFLIFIPLLIFNSMYDLLCSYLFLIK